MQADSLVSLLQWLAQGKGATDFKTKHALTEAQWTEVGAGCRGHSDPAKQYVLGYCYNMGRGVAQDYKEAARLYRLAADQGQAKAQYML